MLLRIVLSTRIMEYTSSSKPQLSSRANAFSIAALMSSGKSKDKESEESTIKPLGKSRSDSFTSFDRKSGFVFCSSDMSLHVRRTVTSASNYSSFI